MKAQTIFYKVVKHLRKQGSKSYRRDPDGIIVNADGIAFCAYLSSDGKKCAAGCLIMKKEYDPSFEGHSIDFLLRNSASLRERLGDHVSLIARLQSIHDIASVEVWEDQFESAARDYNLKYTPPAES